MKGNIIKYKYTLVVKRAVALKVNATIYCFANLKLAQHIVYNSLSDAALLCANFK